MKKTKIMAVIMGLIAVTAALGFAIPEKETHTEYLRIHIRANSNDETDQTVKYAVKERIVEFLTPYVAQAKTKESAEKTICSLLPSIEKVADETLREKGFSYSSRAKINNEKFPTRTYGEYTLESGFYDALIVELGSGKGDNWWCVVYPPLCFTGSGKGYVYKSKIYEIIRNFFEKEAK